MPNAKCLKLNKSYNDKHSFLCWVSFKEHFSSTVILNFLTNIIKVSRKIEYFSPISEKIQYEWLIWQAKFLKQFQFAFECFHIKTLLCYRHYSSTVSSQIKKLLNSNFNLNWCGQCFLSNFVIYCDWTEL